MDAGVRALIDAREARLVAEAEAEQRKAARLRRRSLARALVALVLIRVAYWIGYETGLAAALFH